MPAQVRFAIRSAVGIVKPTVRIAALMATLALADPVSAERDLCTDRPGKGTPACIVDVGALQVEASVADWSHSHDADSVEDETLIADTLLRYGVADHAELRFGWTAYGFDRQRDRASGATDHRRGAGDVTLGVRRNLKDPDGQGFAIALQPFVTLPTGRTPVGGGTWATGLVAPVQISLDNAATLTIDSEIDAAADEDGHGRHLAYSTVIDFNRKLGKNLQVTAEGFVQRDRDPQDHATLASADFSVGYQLGTDGEVDFSVYKGLTSATPRVELVLGFVRRFR